jgi:hypothetical protein
MLQDNLAETVNRYNFLEEALRTQWHLGRDIILCWTYGSNGLTFLSAPYYQIGALISDVTAIKADNRLNDGQVTAINIRDLLKQTRYASSDSLARIKQIKGIKETVVSFPESMTAADIDTDAIDELIKCYGISYVENQAVALFDIVGFSKYNAFDQVTLLSSLSYSINAAYSKLHIQDINVNFALSTTGDGYYIWTKEETVESNIKLYNLVQIILADNAIARTKSYGHTAPLLKTAFHIGNYYEFHQSEALQPTPYSYIVGDVTIELARIIENAMPGQILVGNFNCQLPSLAEPEVYIDVDTIEFIEILKSEVHRLRGVRISHKGIDSIMCYLTGQRVDEQTFTISRYQITDKHDFIRTVFNAKVNIYRDSQPPIYLGIQEKEVLITPRFRRI